MKLETCCCSAQTSIHFHRTSWSFVLEISQDSLRDATVFIKSGEISCFPNKDLLISNDPQSNWRAQGGVQQYNSSSASFYCSFCANLSCTNSLFKIQVEGPPFPVQASGCWGSWESTTVDLPWQPVPFWWGIAIATDTKGSWGSLASWNLWWEGAVSRHPTGLTSLTLLSSRIPSRYRVILIHTFEPICDPSPESSLPLKRYLQETESWGEVGTPLPFQWHFPLT